MKDKKSGTLITLLLITTILSAGCRKDLVIKTRPYYIPLPDKTEIINFRVPKPKTVNGKYVFTKKDFKKYLEFILLYVSYCEKLEARIIKNNEKAKRN